MDYKRKIVAVDNEQAMLKLITYILSKEGYEVIGFSCGEDALGYIVKNKPELIILDVMLPRMSGFEICKIIKNNPDIWSIPVIMLTARINESDILTGFEQGADDYVTKPFSEKIFLARVNAIISRKLREDSAGLNFLKLNELVIYPESLCVKINDLEIDLTSSEFKVLYMMAQKPGRAFTRAQILNELKSEDDYVFERAIDVLMVRLRKKLGLYGKNIETIYGIGYKFKENFTTN